MRNQRLASLRIRRIAEITDHQNRPFLQPFPHRVLNARRSGIRHAQPFLKLSANLPQPRQSGVVRQFANPCDLFGVTAQTGWVSTGASVIRRRQQFENAEQFGDFRFQSSKVLFRDQHGDGTLSAGGNNTGSGRDSAYTGNRNTRTAFNRFLAYSTRLVVWTVCSCNCCRVWRVLS